MKLKRLSLILFVVLAATINSFGQVMLDGEEVVQNDPWDEGTFDEVFFEINNFYVPVTLPSAPATTTFRLEGRLSLPANGDGGPYPLIIVMHGRNFVCDGGGDTTNSHTFPCNENQNEALNHLGFRDLLTFLSSHGYATLSINSNDIINTVEQNSQSITDAGAQLRAELMQAFLDQLANDNEINSVLDFNNIVTVGHSRGGEGIVKHYQYNESLGSPYTIKGVFAVAPLNTNNPITPGMPYAVMLGYCDGDLKDLPGLSTFDRQVENSDAPAHMILVQGANHNYFNELWDHTNPDGDAFSFATDDWANQIHVPTGQPLRDVPDLANSYCMDPQIRLNGTHQRNVLRTYLHSFIKTYVDQDLQYAAPILGMNLKNGLPTPPDNLGLGAGEIYVSYHAPTTKRMSLDIVEEANNPYSYRLEHNGLLNFGICGTADQNFACVSNFSPPNPNFDYRFRDDHFNSPHQTGLARILLAWDTTSINPSMTYDLSYAQGDVTEYSHLTFRSGVTAMEPFTINKSLNNRGTLHRNFTIKLTDRYGNTASTEVLDHSVVLWPPGGSNFDVTPHNTSNTIAIPLTAFESIDLGGVASIEFIFDQAPTGEVFFTDFAFTQYGEGDNTISTIPGYLLAQQSASVVAYPNPAVNEINVLSPDPISSIEIFDLDGNSQGSLSFNNGDTRVLVDISALAPSRLYKLVVNGLHSKTFIKR